jgi:Neuraminidase (sialidase)
LIAAAVAAAEPVVTTRYVAIDNVCAWPNLATLRDGTIVATIFNKPSHGRAEGDVECWATTDGLFWAKRGTAAPHEASANRMNVAAGVANNGDLIVLASVWTLKKDDKGLSLVEILAPWISRSSNGGATWKVDKESFPRAAEGRTQYIPFGDVLAGGDGALRVACYARDLKTRQDGVWMFRSADDGKTWNVQSRISDANNETAIFHLGSGKWLAAARSLGKTKQRLDLFRSEDDGSTWTASEPVSGASQHPAHLTRLKDRRLLLTYGNRIKGQFGVLARLSADEGKTWSEPLTLVNDLLSGDCGYPASAQMRDGKILTAYYSNGAPAHRRYHMGVAIWAAPVR